MDFTTLTILAILSFILAWFGIMIFTTASKDDETSGEPQQQAKAATLPVPQPLLVTQPVPQVIESPLAQTVMLSEPPVAKVAKIAVPEPRREDEVVMYRGLVDKYSSMVLQLKKKIEVLENTTGYAGVSNDTLIDWISELRRENKYLKTQLLDNGGKDMEYTLSTNDKSKREAPSHLRAENEQLRQKLEDHTRRVTDLEQEINEMKNGLQYYRDMVNKLQGSYTVINRYSYRTCIRNPDTGEFHYELVKFPPDFDPFNPTYITQEGMEIFENYGIKIPTALGDIVREEFKKSSEYWEEDAGIDWKLGR